MRLDGLVKRTRREALELCKTLWAEIRDRNLYNKGAAVIWKKVRTDKENCSECFACEYDSTHNRRRKSAICLDECILKNIWPRGCSQDSNSAYAAWAACYEDDKADRFKYADQIVKGCKEALAELDKQKERKHDTAESV